MLRSLPIGLLSTELLYCAYLQLGSMFLGSTSASAEVGYILAKRNCQHARLTSLLGLALIPTV
jgi:hypothetical protein